MVEKSVAGIFFRDEVESVEHLKDHRIIFNMIGIQGYVDEQGLFFANIISKKGRNEIQIYPINKDEDVDSVVVDSSVLKLELEVGEGVRDACWVSYEVLKEKSTAKKRGRKRASEENEKEQEMVVPSYLTVATTEGEILVISPLEGGIINRISQDTEIVRISSSLKNKAVWGLSTQSTLLEFSLDTNKITKKYKLDEVTEYHYIEAIRHKSTPSSKSQNLILASDIIQIVDPFKAQKNSVLHSFDQVKSDGSITSAKQSRIVDTNVYFSRENEANVHLFDMDEARVIRTLKTQDPVEEFNLLVHDDDEFIFVKSGDVINIFSLSQGEDLPLASLRIYDHNNENKLTLSSVFVAKSSQLVGVWYDENVPKFTEIDWDFRRKGEIRVEVDYIKRNHIPSNLPESNISVPDLAHINNLSGLELFEKCYSLLNMQLESINRENVLSLCSSNDDEENIKEAIMSISSSSDASPTMSSNLFTIVSKEVAKNPSKSSSLSLWLKWLLLVCGGHLARQPEHHSSWKNLHDGLSDGQKLMPRLLALQGKFQLLKSQAELREKLGKLEVQEDSYEQVFNYENEEENVVYVNGEYDDFDEPKSHTIEPDSKNSVEDDHDDIVEE